jgi:hypothetical protein
VRGTLATEWTYAVASRVIYIDCFHEWQYPCQRLDNPLFRAGTSDRRWYDADHLDSIITLSNPAGAFALNLCDDCGMPFVQCWRPGAPFVQDSHPLTSRSRSAGEVAHAPAQIPYPTAPDPGVYCAP